MQQTTDRGSGLGFGVPRIITGAQPAAGAEVVVTIPGGVVWDVLSVLVAYTTSAVVAVRVPSLALGDGSTIAERLPSAAGGQAASLTLRYDFVAAIGYDQAVAGSDVVSGIPSIRAYGGWQLSTVTANLQVADQYGAPVLYVLEYFERGSSIDERA